MYEVIVSHVSNLEAHRGSQPCSLLCTRDKRTQYVLLLNPCSFKHLQKLKYLSINWKSYAIRYSLLNCEMICLAKDEVAGGLCNSSSSHWLVSCSDRSDRLSVEGCQCETVLCCLQGYLALSWCVRVHTWK